MGTSEVNPEGGGWVNISLCHHLAFNGVVRLIPWLCVSELMGKYCGVARVRDMTGFRGTTRKVLQCTAHGQTVGHQQEFAGSLKTVGAVCSGVMEGNCSW